MEPLQAVLQTKSLLWLEKLMRKSMVQLPWVPLKLVRQDWLVKQDALVVPWCQCRLSKADNREVRTSRPVTKVTRDRQCLHKNRDKGKVQPGQLLEMV